MDSKWKQCVEDLRGQWRMLWRTRIDDKLRAEGVARHEYPDLFVDRGTVIVATKDYKPLSFHEILRRHLPFNVADAVNPSPFIGGYRKFVKEESTPHAKVPELVFEKKGLILHIQRLLAHHFNPSLGHYPVENNSHGLKERKWYAEATRQYASLFVPRERAWMQWS